MIAARTPMSHPDQAMEAERIQAEEAAQGGSLASKQLIQDTTTKTNEAIHPSITYPAWPTSRPGAQATSPLPGQRPHPLRTDQMVYECYDQEQGLPCIPPLKSAMREHRGKIYLSDASFQDIVSEEEVQQYR